MKCLVPLACLALLAACATPPPEPTAEVVEMAVPVEGLVAVDGQLMLELKSGVYLCEFGANVDVMRESGTGIGDGNRISIGWNGGRYHLERDRSSSGLPRFEDRTNGLVWIDLPWKGVLLDGRTHKPLANECKAE